jgi:hypothetical protein
MLRADSNKSFECRRCCLQHVRLTVHADVDGLSLSPIDHTTVGMLVESTEGSFLDSRLLEYATIWFASMSCCSWVENSLYLGSWAKRGF